MWYATQARLLTSWSLHSNERNRGKKLVKEGTKGESKPRDCEEKKQVI